MGDPHVAALMAAFAVALKARTQQLTDQDVEDMRVKAEELLLKDHPAYPVIVRFSTMYEMERRNPEALALLGDELERGVRLAVSPPEPKLPFRSDIDG
jgi:hypothetical protein